MNPNNGITNGTGSRAHTPEPVRQIRVVVQPPTHVLSGERFNRPLVVLGPLEAAYYVVNAVDPGTRNTAQLIQPGRLASPPPPPPAHDSEVEAQQQNNNGLEVRAQMLRVGVRSAPILDGYDTPSERYYDADEERPGFGYAVWTDLAIASVGPGWKIWIRAMDERDEPLCAVETVSVNVQDLDAMLPHPQPETFGFDQMLWLQRLRRKYPQHATLEPFKEEFWYECTHPDCLIREVHTMRIGESDADWLYRVEIGDGSAEGGPEAVEGDKGVREGDHDSLPIEVGDDDDEEEEDG
ncbi:hypothetical protein PG984_000376 [Apiospora sp. TS-2023a]